MYFLSKYYKSIDFDFIQTVKKLLYSEIFKNN